MGRAALRRPIDPRPPTARLGWHHPCPSPSDALNLDAIRLQLAGRGYHWEKPGEVALRGHAIALFPAGDPARYGSTSMRTAGSSLSRPSTRLPNAPPAAPLRPSSPLVEYALDPDKRDTATPLEGHA